MQKKAELEELWEANTHKESQNAARLRYPTAIHSLYNTTQEDYDPKRTEYRELKAKLSDTTS